MEYKFVRQRGHSGLYGGQPAIRTQLQVTVFRLSLGWGPSSSGTASFTLWWRVVDSASLSENLKKNKKNRECVRQYFQYLEIMIVCANR